MRAQHLLLVVPSVTAYSINWQKPPRTVPGSVSHAAEVDVPPALSVPLLQEEPLFHNEVIFEEVGVTGAELLRKAEAQHGMPWKSSIDENVEDELLYMPFWEWQMDFMEENLTDLKVVSCSNGMTDFSYNENAKKKARIVNLCASSKEYRKIRLSYYDAGDNTQVFNSVWYPRPGYNLPILGVDLLAFNRKKYLAIVDFQPLHQDEADHAAEFEHILEPIKEKYDSLKGRMSAKFYDETQFFSQQMLFARFDQESIVQDDLLPAFKSYVEAHLSLLKSTPEKPEDKAMVMERQKEYDSYSAERDPATGLFAAMYGADWANDFVHDFLFSMSEKKEGSPPPPPMAFMGGGGGPPPASAGGSDRNPAQQKDSTTETQSRRP